MLKMDKKCSFDFPKEIVYEIFSDIINYDTILPGFKSDSIFYEDGLSGVTCKILGKDAITRCRGLEEYDVVYLHVIKAGPVKNLLCKIKLHDTEDGGTNANISLHIDLAKGITNAIAKPIVNRFINKIVEGAAEKIAILSDFREVEMIDSAHTHAERDFLGTEYTEYDVQHDSVWDI